LDELDTGLDIDALKIVLSLIRKNQNKYGWIIISHSSRILKKLKPTYVHIINNGCIAECGGVKLLNKVEKEGFTNV
jgi:Fe-S cluster assembly ATP-binding protein